METMKEIKFSFHPATKKRWNDLELLFGDNGACGGCWCMWWRLKRKEFNANKGDGNKNLLKKLLNKKTAPGIIAYKGKIPAGWIAFAPRSEYPVLENSRVLKRIDDLPVWSVTCFFINKNYRRQGLSTKLLNEAADYAAKKGAEILEGYPVDAKKGKYPDVFVYTGIPSAFKKAGFKEAERRSETRPIMRRVLKP